MIKRIILTVLTVLLVSSLVSCGYAVADTDYYTEKDYDRIWELPGVSVSVDGGKSVFPESIDNLEIKDFFCRYDQQLPLGEGVQVFLRIKCDDELFESEIQRLQDLGQTDFDDLFEESGCTAFVNSLGEEYSYYEYALIDETEREIIYVYLESLPKDEIEMNFKYLPSNYQDYGRE